MILREWRAYTTSVRRAEYPKYFRGNVLPELRQVPGFVSASLSERRDGKRVEFVVLTRWASMEAIRAFAGADLEQAVVGAGAIATLTDCDRKVRHYKVLEDCSAD
jgi:heme-degrading monooxygenase HmoA